MRQVKIGVIGGKISIKGGCTPGREHDDGRIVRVRDRMRGPGVLKSSLIADYLCSYARWRLDRAEEPDEGRNARSAVALLDAAAYARELDDSARIVVRMSEAGCFGEAGFRPGAEAERIIRDWRYGSAGRCDSGAAAELLEAVAGAAEHRRDPARESVPVQDGTRPGARSKSMAGSRRRAKSRSRRR